MNTETRFKVKYMNPDSPDNGKVFYVREHKDYPNHYLISDGKSHVGGGTLLKKYCLNLAEFKSEPIKSNEGNVWVKVSERLPEKHGIYFCKFHYANNAPDTISNCAIKFDGDWVKWEGDTVIEWLDENHITPIKSNDDAEQQMADLFNNAIQKNVKNKEDNKKSSFAEELKTDIKLREETLSYIRDIMERNKMQHPGELFNYWKNKRDNISKIFTEQKSNDVGVERFKIPTDDEIIKIALIFNDGRLDANELTNMVSMCKLVTDRLYENGDIMIPSSKENK